MSHSLPHWDAMEQFDADLLRKLEPFRDKALGPGALSLRDKEIVMLSMIMMMRFEPGIRLHFNRAMDEGATAQELFEVCTTLMLVAGVPTFRVALLILQEVVAEREAAGKPA